MVFTQRPLSLGESFGHERRNPLVSFYSDGNSGTPSISVQAANLWYDVWDTYIVHFVADGCRKNLPLSADSTMVDASNSLYLSFTTDDRDDPKSWSETGEAIRLQLAAAFKSAGAEIDTKMHPHESDWLFYGVRNGMRFTVVLVVIKFAPCTWFTSIEGSHPEEKPDPTIRAWAQPIIESTLRLRTGTANFTWHDTHLTLPKP